MGLTFDRSEVDFFYQEVLAGENVSGYLSVLQQANKLIHLILELIHTQQPQRAAQIYTWSTVELAPTLMSAVNLQSPEARMLAELFMSVGHYLYAGKVYEQLSDFRQAALAFEQSEDFDRAAYCWERFGDVKRAELLRQKKSETPAVSPQPTLVSASALTTSARNTATSGAGVFSLDVAVPPPPMHGALLSATDKDLFHKSSLFSELSFEQRSRIWQISSLEMVPAQTPIVEVGSEPAGVFMILEGQVVALRISEGVETPFTHLHAGDIFGEFWLLAEQPANIRFTALTPCRVLVIDRSRFTALLEMDGAIARKVYKQFTQRLMTKLFNPMKSKDYYKAS